MAAQRLGWRRLEQAAREIGGDLWCGGKGGGGGGAGAEPEAEAEAEAQTVASGAKCGAGGEEGQSGSRVVC